MFQSRRLRCKVNDDRHTVDWQYCTVVFAKITRTLMGVARHSSQAPARDDIPRARQFGAVHIARLLFAARPGSLARQPRSFRSVQRTGRRRRLLRHFTPRESRPIVLETQRSRDALHCDHYVTSAHLLDNTTPRHIRHSQHLLTPDNNRHL